MLMKSRNFHSTVLVVFLAIGLAHLWRAMTATKVMVGLNVIPVWVSWVAAIVALYLAYNAYKHR